MSTQAWRKISLTQSRALNILLLPVLVVELQIALPSTCLEIWRNIVLRTRV